MLNRIKEKYKNTSSFLKFTLFTEAIIVTCLFITMTFVTARFSSVLREKEIALGEKRLESLVDFMQVEYTRIYGLNNYILNGGISDILARISKNEQEAYYYKNIQDIQVFFSGISYADENISDVIFISTRGNVYSYTRQASYEINPSYNFLEYEPVQTFLKSDDNRGIFYSDPSEYCIRERSPVVSFVGKIYDVSLLPKKEVVGLYIINVSIEKFDKVQESATDTVAGDLYIVGRDDKILYSSEHSNCGALFGLLQENKNQKCYVITQRISNPGVDVYYILPEYVLFSEIKKIVSQVIIVLFIAILVTFVLGNMLSAVFQKKMNVLIESMHQVQEGNFKTRLPVDAQDEIGKISESFNEMCGQLNTYVDKVYKAEIQRKNAEMNALQTQINPHFLYNTLESIKSKALMNDDEETADMVMLLGNMFRWISRTGDKMATLEEELEYVKNYLKLQSYRYNEKLDYDMEVDEEFLDYEVPKLILQPIIENSIKHALDDVSGKKLLGIQARRKTDTLEITIYDNGHGISKEKLQEINGLLNNAEEQDEFESIGLENVNQRLKLMYGTEYGLQIKSIEGYGTAVKMRIPIETE